MNRMILIIALLVCCIPGFGLVVKTGNNVTIAENEIIDDDLIVFAQSITIDGTVQGDVFAFGQTVTVRGDIAGSLFTGAAMIAADMRRVKTVWAAGGNVKVAGDVDKNAILAGGSLVVDRVTHIRKDLRVFGGHCAVAGAIDGTIRGGVGEFVMAGRSGTIDIDADKATIQSGTVISGDFILTSKQEPTIEQGVTIAGETKVAQPEEGKKTVSAVAFSPIIAFVVAFLKIIMLVSKILVGVVVTAISKPFVRRIRDTIVNKPWNSLGWGFLGMIVIPVSVIILFVVLVGSPIAIFGMYVYTILFYLSSIFVGLVIGERLIRLFKKEGDISLYLSFIVGIIILFALGLVPVLGLLVKVAVLLFGAGALLLGGWNLAKAMREKELM